MSTPVPESIPQSAGAVVQLDPHKEMHVLGGAQLAGREREFETRRFIWLHALTRSIAMLRVSIRAFAWAQDEGRNWDHLDQSFPTPVDGFEAARGLAQMAVITFLTIFKSGRRSEGDAAGNLEAEVTAFRENCLSAAFPDTQARDEFNCLRQRLEQARDGLLAHADGAAQEISVSGAVTSFHPDESGISRGDVAALLACAERLLEVIRNTRMVGRGAKP